MSAAARHAEQKPTTPGLDPPSSSIPSFLAIYEQYFDLVWRSARRLGVNELALDDVVQDVFVVIHKRLATVQHPESLPSWIYGVVRRIASDYRRSKRHRELSSATLSNQYALESEPPPTPLDLNQQKERVAILWELLNAIDAAKREVFVLAELQELSAPQIAALLGIPVNTAYSRLRVARQAFEQALARRMGRWQGG